ncbi:ferric reductase-like transmembrane domain-containing protein [Cellulomonas sp. H30R-01]|uniref:ferredoxin reductase family protein n=1 Tax=Cellulomonas sp. H30R-01 TaxID=2704467 RepID=UPI001EE4C46D|nr:ferric reductase-like transmembrane domain-containing protein [Cellulomonas sp. H30R-01]
MSTTTVEQPPAAAPPPLPVRLRPPRAARWWPDAVTALTWATVVWVVGLWATGGGVGALAGSPADVLGTIGRLSGLLASDLLLLQVLGMARIPWAERAFGQDRLARWHRWTGFTSFHLLLVHMATLVVSSALAAGTGVVREAWDMVTTLPGMLIATAGTALLVAVVTSSLRAARRRVRYESWHLLHLYAYLGVGLAVPHQLWTGTDFVGRPWAAVFWWALWGAAVAAVLVFRVGLPLRMSVRHHLRVDRVVAEAPGLVSVYVGGRHLEGLRVAAGQFFVWRFLTGPGWTRGHPLSLSAVPTSAGLRLTVGTRGDDGERLARLRPGTRVLVEGPYGRLTPRVRTRPRLAGFAAGSGVAPVMALLHDSAWRPGADTLVLRTSTVEETPLAADVAWLVRDRGLRYVPLTGARSTTGTTWLPADLGHVPGPDAVRWLVPDLDEHDVVVCGPGPWADAVVAAVRAAGVPDSALHLERYDW